MGARLLLLSFDCPAVAGGGRSRLSAVPRMSSGAPRVRPPASSVRASAATAARGNLPHHTSVVVEGGGAYTVGDFMTKREQLHVVKPSTSVDEALERLVEHRITGFPVTDDHWNLVGVVSDYDLLALDSISGNGQAEADIFPEVDSTWKVVLSYVHVDGDFNPRRITAAQVYGGLHEEATLSIPSWLTSLVQLLDSTPHDLGGSQVTPNQSRRHHSLKDLAMVGEGFVWKATWGRLEIKVQMIGMKWLDLNT